MAQEEGYALKLGWEELSESLLYETIQKLINQQRYLIIFNILFFFVFSKFKLNCDYFEIATERTRHVYLR